MSIYADMEAFRAARPRMTAEQLAKLFLKRTTKAALEPLIAKEFWQMERRETRAVEMQAVLAAPQPVRRTGRIARCASELEGLRELLDRPYRSRGTEERLLRFMTRDEHQARIDMLVAHRAGVDRSIELHREAIRLIDTAHVSCLNDLDTTAVAAAA